MLFQDYCWKVPSRQFDIYLTFDDGPTPGVTEPILDWLDRYNYKATFFCVGQQIEKHPDVFLEIVRAGHTIGNHTYTHLHGWYCSPEKYLQEIEQTSQLIEQLAGFRPKVFRPPYGKFSPSVTPKILKNYRIIMWDILAGDFDPSLQARNCIQYILKYYQQGSIIVLHDSLKCKSKVLRIVPEVLQYFHNQNFRLLALNDDNLDGNHLHPSLFFQNF